MNNGYAQYKEIFKQNKGILRASKAIRLGIPEYIIYEMTKNGDLVREARGLYRLTEIGPLGNPDLIQVALLIPKSVIFLISALYFHRLTTQIPHRVYIALPREVKPPKIDYPPIKVYRLRHNPFISGIEEHEIDGVTVRIYNKEKTIADCFKYRNQIGMGIALEALKDYMNESSPKIENLIEFARINRVEKIMHPYIETLI